MIGTTIASAAMRLIIVINFGIDFLFTFLLISLL